MTTPVDSNTPAPDFLLAGFSGHPVRLSDYRGERHSVVVFNRGFF